MNKEVIIQTMNNYLVIEKEIQNKIQQMKNDLEKLKINKLNYLIEQASSSTIRDLENIYEDFKTQSSEIVVNFIQNEDFKTQSSEIVVNFIKNEDLYNFKMNIWSEFKTKLNELIESNPNIRVY